MGQPLEGAKARPEPPHRRSSQSKTRLLHTSRGRLHAAVLFSLAVAAILAFVVFPVRRIVINADGVEREVVTRSSDLATLLRLAGIEPDTGDIAVRSGAGVRLERAVPVVVKVDGRTLAWRTRAETVRELLLEMGLDVSPYDGILYDDVEVEASERLFPGPLAALVPSQLDSYSPEALAAKGVTLEIKRAVPLTIVEDGQPIVFRSARPTVAMALRDAGIRLGPGDEVFPPPSSPLVAGQEVNVRHAKAVILRVGGTSRVLYTHQLTLRDALAEAGLSLGPDDRVEPAVDGEVTNGMTARLIRVAGRQFIEKDLIPRKTVFRPDESLSGHSTRVVQGNDGVRYREFRVVIEDGVETERKLIREWWDPEPSDTTIFYAASTLRATGLSPEQLQVAEIKRMYATWYNAASAGKPATDPYYGITASGLALTKGIVAVDPSVIPLGTRVYIPGYGVAVAADTGGGIVGNMIDLGYPDGVAVDWRTGWVDVYVLAP